jgi:hypothetical protein
MYSMVESEAVGHTAPVNSTMMSWMVAMAAVEETAAVVGIVPSAAVGNTAVAGTTVGWVVAFVAEGSTAVSGTIVCWMVELLAVGNIVVAG